DDDDVDQLANRVVRADGVNRQRPRVAVRAQATEHRVGEPALLTNGLKETRAHRTTEHRVQHVARIAVLVILLVAAGAEADVTLFELLVADDDARLDARARGRKAQAFGRHGSERRLDDVADLLVLDVADG